MKARLDAIRECFEGVIPATLATCAADGTPNLAVISQVQYVDPEHIALSFQFFNRTRKNILENPFAQVVLIHPSTATQYRLMLQYLRTETSGPLFEAMKAKLAGIASHTGMSGIFHLQGSDLYRVLAVERLEGASVPPPPPRANLLSALRSVVARLPACADLESLLQAALDGLEARFGISHAMVLVLDCTGGRLYTVASRGYEASGVGSEIPLGQGVIGVCAREGTPIRLGHMASEYAYSRAMREAAEQGGLAGHLETEIPFPGLQGAASQIAVPILGAKGLLGVLFAESREHLRFGYDEEDALVVLAAHLGLAMQDLQASEPAAEPAASQPPPAAAPPEGKTVILRYFPENDSVFLDGDYLIKGVAGNIFWVLAQEQTEKGRTDFSNRELRLDPRIKLPELGDNLEARLVLLARRLEERGAVARIERTGRGRFRLRVDRPLELVEVPQASSR